MLKHYKPYEHYKLYKLLDGVVAAFTPRIATHNTPRSHNAPFYYTIFFDRLIGVNRAGGVVLAKTMAKKTAQRTVVE